MSSPSLSPHRLTKSPELTERMHDSIFNGAGFAAFEIVQIANLCPATAEEAKALIPR